MTWAVIWRGPTGLSFRQCLRVSAAPTGIALLVAVIAHATSTPKLVHGNAAAAATPWLTLPLMVVAVACCLAAAHTWPLFAQQQPGADSIRRIERGLFGGRLAIIAGALFAQCLLSIPLAVTLSAWFDAPSAARRHHVATSSNDAYLSRVGDKLTFVLTDAPQVEALWLRPRANMPTGIGATEVSITNNGKLLATTPVAFSESGALLRIAIQPQQLHQIELTKTAGNVPLWFNKASVIAVGPANLPTWCNSILAALIATWTSALTLLIAAIVGTGTGWATLATTICCAQFVQWIGGTGPIDDALLQLMRGQGLW